MKDYLAEASANTVINTFYGPKKTLRIYAPDLGIVVNISQVEEISYILKTLSPMLESVMENMPVDYPGTPFVTALAA